MWHFRRNWGKNAACSMQQAAYSSRSTTDGLSQPHNRANVSRHAGSIWIPVCLRVKAFPKTAWHAKWQTVFISPPSTLGWLIEFLHIALANSTIGWKATQSPFPRKKKDKKAEQEIECATKLCRSKLRCMHPHAPCQLLKSSLSLKSKFIACKKS